MHSKHLTIVLSPLFHSLSITATEIADVLPNNFSHSEVPVPKPPHKLITSLQVLLSPRLNPPRAAEVLGWLPHLPFSPD